MKLEAIGPEEKDKELDVLHLEHVTYTPAPPEPKREGTNPSVHTWISDGVRESGCTVACAVWNKGGNSEVGCRPWGDRGHVIRVSRGDGSGCVAEV